MPPTNPLPCASLLFLAATVVSMTGCGVAGYEAKMKEEKERLANFDIENNVLGPPLEEPAIDVKKKGEDSKEKPEDIPSIFFRAPKGISSEFRRQPKDGGKRDRKYGDLFYIYPRATNESPVAELLLAVYTDPKNEVYKDLLKNPRLQGLQSTSTGKTRKLEPFGRAPFTLEERESSDMLFYFYQKDAYRAALVFLVDTGKMNDAKEKITISLRSLAVGPDSTKPRTEYRTQTAAKATIQASTASTQP